MSDSKISSEEYFAEYHGHKLSHLKTALIELRGCAPQVRRRPIVFLMGDSTLDNKFWLRACPRMAAGGGYERFISPPLVVPDVTSCLIAALSSEMGLSHTVLNCAVEESTLQGRVVRQVGSSGPPQLTRPHDIFAAQACGAVTGDIMVLSLGGNDIVLSPSLSTIAALVGTLHCASISALESGTAWGFNTLIKLFRDDMQTYINALYNAGARPSTIIVLFPYLPERAGSLTQSSWADTSLKLLGYDAAPENLERVMRAVYKRATCLLQPPPMASQSTRIIPVALFDGVLDSTSGSGDFIARVEPSAKGSAKIAHRLAKIIKLIENENVAEESCTGARR